MQRRKFGREFKVEAVRMIQERGVSVAQAARDLDVHETVLHRWVKQAAADPQHALPGHGQMWPEQAEIARLRKEVARLRAERDIQKRRHRVLRAGRAMRFAFIAKHRTLWPVAWMCAALNVSRSDFRAWLTRSPSQRARDDAAILTKVHTSFGGSDRTYGARRVWHDVLAEGVACGLHRIERIVRENAMRARPRQWRGLPKDEGVRTAAANLLERQFAADGPSRKWIADVTYIWTTEGGLYVAAVIDLFSRRVVG